MPIKSIDQSYEFGSGLPCIGRLRKGGAKTDPRRPGPDLTYFRFTPEPGFERFAGVFEHFYGKEPQFFSPVRFGGSTIEDVFDFWMKEHTATKMTRKCDGETQVRHFDASTGETSTEPVACAAPDCACKQVGRLKLFLPDLINEIGVFGYVMLTTTSLYDIRNILSCMRDLERIIGDLSSVDFLIGRASRIISVPVPKPKDAAAYKRKHERDWKPGDRMNTTKNLIYIRPNERFTKQVLLGVVSSDAPQLPERSASATMQVLNNGQPRPQRRIGSPPPPVTDDYEDDEVDDAPEWLDEGLKWIKDNFEMTPAQINTALEVADGWQVSRDVFKAAIIAAKFDYDPALIEQYTSSKNLLGAWEASKRIVARVERPEAEVIP